VFNPFFGVAHTEISNIFMHALPEHLRQNYNFSILIGVVAELYYLMQGKNLNLKTLISDKTDIVNLMTKVQETEQQGKIDTAKMLELNGRISVAQADLTFLSM
jgi:hypothetical protein